MKQSIRGKILVTRTAKDCEQWAIQLKKAGAIPVIFPCITCETIQTTDLNRMLSEGLKTSDWIVFTSRRGVSAFSSLVEELGQHELTKKIKIAVVGPATNNSATQLLGRVDLMSEAGTAKSLGEKLASILQTKCSVSPPKILILVAENAGTIIERTLTASGCECTRLNVYRTVAIKKNTHKQSLSLLDVDKIILASPSAVLGLTNQVHFDNAVEIFSIGPSTSRAVQAAGLEVTAEAAEPSLKGLMEIMK